MWKNLSYFYQLPHFIMFSQPLHSFIQFWWWWSNNRIFLKKFARSLAIDFYWWFTIYRIHKDTWIFPRKIKKRVKTVPSSNSVLSSFKINQLSFLELTVMNFSLVWPRWNFLGFWSRCIFRSDNTVRISTNWRLLLTLRLLRAIWSGSTNNNQKSHYYYCSRCYDGRRASNAWSRW